MSISQIPSAAPSINELVLLAFKRASLLPIEAKLSGANMVPKLEHGRATLNLILDGLQTEGITARTTVFHDLPITAGESYYTLPESILDVVNDAMFIPSENADTKFTTGELVCTQVGMTTWQLLTVKGSESTRPQMFTVLRSGAQVELRFWPVPSEAGTMRLQIVRLLGGSAAGSGQLDLQRYWHDVIVWDLAHYLAVDASMPAEKTAMLANMAAMKKQQALRFSTEHVAVQASLSYQTQWSA